MMSAEETDKKEKLLKASSLILYEITMFIELKNILLKHTYKNKVVQNAIVESFVIHTRVLLDFLYLKEIQDDIIADQYFDDYESKKSEKWIETRDAMTIFLEDIRKRSHKRAAHLTYARLDLTPEDKGWDVPRIAKELLSVIDKFVMNAPVELLDPKFDEYKKARNLI